MATCRSSHPSFYDPTHFHSPNDLLACGNRRSEHDLRGNCDSCDVCLQPLCSSNDDARTFEGLAVHTDCLKADRRKKTILAIKQLIEASAELTKVDEEFLTFDNDSREDLDSQAADAIFDLRQWATRNALTLNAILAGGAR